MFVKNFSEHFFEDFKFISVHFLFRIFVRIDTEISRRLGRIPTNTYEEFVRKCQIEHSKKFLGNLFE